MRRIASFSLIALALGITSPALALETHTLYQGPLRSSLDRPATVSVRTFRDPMSGIYPRLHRTVHWDLAHFNYMDGAVVLVAGPRGTHVVAEDVKIEGSKVIVPFVRGAGDRNEHVHVLSIRRRTARDTPFSKRGLRPYSIELTEAKPRNTSVAGRLFEQGGDVFLHTDNGTPILVEGLSRFFPRMLPAYRDQLPLATGLRAVVRGRQHPTPTSIYPKGPRIEASEILLEPKTDAAREFRYRMAPITLRGRVELRAGRTYRLLRGNRALGVIPGCAEVPSHVDEVVNQVAVLEAWYAEDAAGKRLPAIVTRDAHAIDDGATPADPPHAKRHDGAATKLNELGR